MGLWQQMPRLCGDDFESMRDHCVRYAMKKLLILQAYANGVGQKMRQAMEDYRSVDEQLLTELGRNPTLEEIAEALHMDMETVMSVKGMIESARLVNRVTEEPEEDPQEQEQAVEDTAYFQMRQRIADLLSSLDETDDHCHIRLSFLRGVDNADTHCVKLVHHMAVVDNRPQGDHAAIPRSSFVHRFHRPADTEAESGTFRCRNHTGIFSATIFRITSTTPSMSSSEVSTLMESLAIFKGASARWVSW